MKAGSFNIKDYLEKLHESSEEGGLSSNSDGMVIPDENKKSFDWLKKEFNKGKTEVKVEMSSHDFKPGYQMENPSKSVKDFKPGMYGHVKTSENNVSKDSTPNFPETKFPGSSESSKENGEKKKSSAKKVEVKTKGNNKKKEEVEDQDKE